MQESKDQNQANQAAAQEPAAATPADSAAALEAQAQELLQSADTQRAQSNQAPQDAPAAPAQQPAAPEDASTLKQLQRVRSRCSFLSLCCLVLAAAVIGGGVYCYQELSLLKQAQSAVDSKAAALDAAQSSLTQAQQQAAALIQTNQTLQQSSAQLMQAQSALAAKVEALTKAQASERVTATKLQEQLAQYAARDPSAWRVAESYFEVAEAYRQTAFARNPTAAIWNLQQADRLLVNIEEEDILAVREAIAADLSALSAVKVPDLTGVSLRLEQLYRDTAKLVLAGMSDPKQRAAAFEKQHEPTENIADWKNNLVTSAKEFSSRFIEIRRRAPDAAAEFLSPQQETYLRENIRTRLLLAKLALTQGAQANFAANLHEAARLVDTYFDKENALTEAMLNALAQLSAVTIELDMPRVLQSHQRFEKLAAARIHGLQG